MEKASIVLISFREWLHSYIKDKEMLERFKAGVLISFREWLHSYPDGAATIREQFRNSSHLFQRVASFLLATITITTTTM